MEEIEGWRNAIQRWWLTAAPKLAAALSLKGCGSTYPVVYTSTRATRLDKLAAHVAA